MTLLELLEQLQRILVQHPDLADREIYNREGDEISVKVSDPGVCYRLLTATQTADVAFVSAQGSPYKLVKGLIVG